jgi:WD40 repeat protein
VHKGFGVENRSDSDSSSPDFVPAKPKPERQSLTGNMASSVARANDALSNFMSQPSIPAPMLAVNDKGSQKRIETNAKPKIVPQQTRPTNNSGSNHGIPYTKEEDDLLKYLREERNVSWDEMIDHFSGRTRGSLQVRYSTKLKNRDSTTINRRASEARVPSSAVQKSTTPMTPQEYAAPARRVPKATTRNDGFVSWGEIKAKRIAERAVVIPDTIEQEPVQPIGSAPSVAASIPRLLRSREMGNICGRNWSSKSRLKVPDELQNHVLDTLGPRKFFHGASRDVTCVAWANDGNRFAAGAIAIDDERSMQYNRPNNLLLGNNERNSLQELPEHHVSRPAVSDSSNVNSLHAMQETQDPRLFKTVAAVAFSGDSQALYSAGGDGIVRMYDSSNGECQQSFSQGAEVVLLTANSRGLLASGCHRSDDSSISVLSDQLDSICTLGPSRTNVQSSLPIFPSALKWGTGRYSSLLLAGFASDSYDEDRLAAGEVCLWDVAAGNKIELPTVRNVFDVAWNPSPSVASNLFAVACARSGRTYRSSIECFAPHQGRARSVLKWDCQAFDINDVLYCPHDDNLIAAGATDGKVYVWDKRFANCRDQGQAPLHIFAHGPTKNVLDPERDPEIADTGVRFLSWSSTGDRLYSGSSDGTVKVWNPYSTTEDALVRDVATFNSAIMSGAFSPDYRELLIGEDQGQLNLLGIDREERSVRAAKKFDYYPAAKLSSEDDKLAPARELLNSQQIEFKPMGALPTRQAVQGPDYQGPFLAPSEEQRQHLVTDYELALQQEKKALAGFPRDAEIEKSIKSAQLQVSQTRTALHRAQQKADDSKLLAPAALLLQAKFLESRHAWKKGKLAIGANTCRLDCNYLPAAGDEYGEAPDDRRSEQRVPGSIRPQRNILNAGDMTNSEIAEAGLTSKCIACTGPAAKPKPKRGLPLCESCSLSRSGLTARCSKCATPTRPNLNDNENDHPNICERCNFHCFRCGSVAAVSPEGDTVTCEPCGIQWEAGALGYEVKRSLKLAVARVRDEEPNDHEMVSYEMESLEQRMTRLFGDDERDRLAGGWKVALVDGS